MKLLGFGDCCVDYYIHKKTAFPGGNGLNVAVFAAENGVESGFLGTVGTDEIGRHIIKCAKMKGVDISHCPVKKGNSGRAAVNIVDGDRKFIKGYFKESHGVGTYFPPMLSECDLEYMKGYDLIHGSCYAYIEDQFLRLKNLGPLLSFDFSVEEKFRREEYLRPLCEVLDFALFSCEGMCTDDIDRFVAGIQKMGCTYVLATMGPRGQRFYAPEGKVYVGQAKMIQAIDTMGAGDSFCAAFLSSLLRHGWTKETEITDKMAETALSDGREYSARNCLVEGSFGMGLPIEFQGSL